MAQPQAQVQGAYSGALEQFRISPNNIKADNTENGTQPLHVCITTTPVKRPPNTPVPSQEVAMMAAQEVNKEKEKEEREKLKKKEEGEHSRPPSDFAVVLSSGDKRDVSKRSVPSEGFMALMRPVVDDNPSNPISLSPTYEELCKMGPDKLMSVSDFKIFREGSVMIEFKEPVCLLGTNFSRVFDFGDVGTVKIYNAPQTLLSAPCTVTFYDYGKDVEDVSFIVNRFGPCFDPEKRILKLDFKSLKDLYTE